MRRTLLVALLAAALLRPMAAVAGAAEDDAYGAFEFFCIENIYKLEKFRDLLPPVGFVAVPADQAGPFLNGHAGSAWMGKTANTRLVLAESEDKACTLIAPDVDAAAEVALFRKTAVSKEIHTERNGSQVDHMFAVTQRDPDGGPDIRVMAMVRYSTLASVTGITMTALPASEFPGHEVEWPTLPSD
jgi:hypothetical protein